MSTPGPAARLAEIAIRHVPHGVALLVAAMVLAGDEYPLLPVGWLFLCAPAIERMLGEADGSEECRAPARAWAKRLAPWTWLPVQLMLIAAGMEVARSVPGPLGAAVAAIPLGMLSGIFGMAAAHELMHRSGLGRISAGLMLASWGYGHFLVEHLQGHHRRVGTSEDPASARQGESVYAFIPRSVFGGLRSALQLELERLTRQGRHRCGLHNRMLLPIAMSAIFLFIFGSAAGTRGAAFFVVHCATVIWILEVMNYVQHYGLRRSNMRTRVAACHAWDCRSKLTNWWLFDLGLHVDHHLSPQDLDSNSAAGHDAPRLPAGYFAMFALALLPPLWFLVMDPRVELVRRRLGLGLEPFPAQRLEKEPV